MATTRLLLVTGERLEVGGSIEDIAKSLENAARSGAGTLAWLVDAATDEPFGLNPAHFVIVSRGDD
jgi:hypothetical protein